MMQGYSETRTLLALAEKAEDLGFDSVWGERWRTIAHDARAAGRDASRITGAVYVTIAVDDTAERAERRLMDYLTGYYGKLAPKFRGDEACYAGSSEGAAEWLGGFVAAGASHLVLKLTGDHDRQLEAFAELRARIGG